MKPYSMHAKILSVCTILQTVMVHELFNHTFASILPLSLAEGWQDNMFIFSLFQNAQKHTVPACASTCFSTLPAHVSRIPT